MHATTLEFHRIQKRWETRDEVWEMRSCFSAVYSHSTTSDKRVRGFSTQGWNFHFVTSPLISHEIASGQRNLEDISAKGSINIRCSGQLDGAMQVAWRNVSSLLCVCIAVEILWDSRSLKRIRKCQQRRGRGAKGWTFPLCSNSK